MVYHHHFPIINQLHTYRLPCDLMAIQEVFTLILAVEAVAQLQIGTYLLKI